MYINAARNLIESFFIKGVPHGRNYQFTPYTHKNIGKGYGLTWRIVDRKVFPASKAKHRPALVVTTISPDPKPGKYVPHQGKRECARRLKALAHG